MLRYIRRLQARDLSLTHSMIPLGSCTMKLNATSEMLPVTWAEFGRMHPFAPADQTKGYQQLFADLEQWLAEITGFRGGLAAAQRRVAGRIRRAAGDPRRTTNRAGEGHRNVCLIPVSAHGTNPSSAVIAGLKVVPVACDAQGNIDVEDLKAKADEHSGRSRRADDHVSVDARRLRGGRSRTSARSCTSTAGRCTWTART